MPAGAALRVNRQLAPLIEPVAQLRARAGLGHVERCLGPQRGNPAVPAERQRRTFDAPAEQPSTEVRMEPPEGTEIDAVVVYPGDLDDLDPAGGAHVAHCRLVPQRQPAVSQLSHQIYSITPLSSKSANVLSTNSCSHRLAFSAPGW